jgi:hypothetical protein
MKGTYIVVLDREDDESVRVLLQQRLLHQFTTFLPEFVFSLGMDHVEAVGR